MNKCCECFKPKMFKTYSALRRHAKKFHAEKLDNVAPLKRSLMKYNFTCQHCSKHFNHKSNLTLHIRKVHSDLVLNEMRRKDRESSIKKCPLCTFKSPFKKDIHKHFKSEHDLNLCELSIEFKSFTNFIDWKSNFEKLNTCLFVMERGVVCRKSMRSYYYICHRSGYFISESKGKRHLKRQGSNKINGFCPASITVSEREDGSCNVVYIDMHVGHINNLSCLPQSRKQKFLPKNASDLSYTPVDDDIGVGVKDDVGHGGQHIIYYDKENVESETFKNNEKFETIDKSQTAASCLNDEKEKLQIRFNAVLDCLKNDAEIETLKNLLTQIESKIFGSSGNSMSEPNRGDFSEPLRYPWLVG